MSESSKPAWRHTISYEFAKWVNGRAITKIKHHWTMTGVDTSDNWITLHDDKGGSRKCPVKLSSQWNAEVYFCDDYRGLVRLNDDVMKSIAAIEKWERQNARDIAELKRLQAKLGTKPPQPRSATHDLAST